MRRTLLSLSLLSPLLLVIGCARAEPGTFFGAPTVQDWELAKKERLVECEHDPDVDTEREARRCLGPYEKHRGTRTCIDASAWVSRVADGNTDHQHPHVH